MQFTNNLTVDVLVFVYDVDDSRYFTAIRNPATHLAVWANAEALVPSGQTAALTHTRDTAWLVGVKRAAGAGRSEPFIAPLTPQAYEASSKLELNAPGTLVWLNGPTIVNPTPRLTPAELQKPLPPAAGHVVGVGRANITDMSVRDPASRVPMQGWTNPSQASTALDVDDRGRELPLQARAFTMGDPGSGTRVVMVVVDLWSCSIAIKQEVVRRLSSGSDASPYTHDNVLIAGTHTHSAPAGYLHHFLYNAAAVGFDPHVFESIVSGIVFAIEEAHRSLAPGRVRATAGPLAGITRNRSMSAFSNNPAGDVAAFPSGVDETMTVLAFERETPAGPEPYVLIGALTWFAIHPTNLGSAWTGVSGDNKGWAAHLMEQRAKGAVVAGFANGCAGDASGNFLPGAAGFDSVEGTNFGDQHQRMKSAGEAQVVAAEALVKRGGSVLTGPVTATEYRVNLPMRTKAPAALGLSMAAGSVEDGGAGALDEGITLLNVARPAETSAGNMLVGSMLTSLLLPLNRLLASAQLLLSGVSLGALQSLLSFTPVVDPALLVAHFPKPILLTPGVMVPEPWVPDVVPLQLVRIGSFAVLGLPAEVTTVAGLRISREMSKELSRAGVETTAISTYTNGYAQYITTPEEYDTQQYEGASTLYGRDTCAVVAQAALELARGVTRRSALVHDGPLADRRVSVLTKRRMTFRNESGRRVRFRLYSVRDPLYISTLWPNADFTVEPNLERAVVLPYPHSLFEDMVQVVWGTERIGPGKAPKQRLLAASSDLVLVQASGRVVRAEYFPPSRRL